MKMICGHSECNKKAKYIVFPKWNSMFSKTFHFCVEHSERAEDILKHKEYNFTKEQLEGWCIN